MVIGQCLATKMGLVVYNVDRAEAYLRTKWHLDSSSRLATTDMSRKVRDCCAPPLFQGEV